MKATIILDGSDWVASVESGTSLRFPCSFYGGDAWRHAQTWADHRGAKTIEWVPCPLKKEHRSGEQCSVCGRTEQAPTPSRPR